MQINQTTLAGLFTGFKALYLEAFNGARVEHPRLAMRSPSTNAQEVYSWLGAIPGMKRLLGEIVIENLSAASYTITNDEFESTVAVRQAEIERDNTGMYSPLIRAMGQAAAVHPDELCAALLMNGFTATDYTGSAFFATGKKHEPGSKATFSNKGTKKLSAGNFQTARAAIKGMLNSRGRPMGLGQSLLLVVSPTYEATARQILIADTSANGATNVDKGTADLLVWPQLASAEHNWFLLDVGYPVKPLIHQVEVEPAITAQTSPESDHVFKKHEFLYQAYGRYNAGYGLPQLAWGSTGADAA